MFGNRPLVFIMSVCMLSTMQTSVAESKKMMVNFNDTANYIFLQHPNDASEWICVVGTRREIICARVSDYYEENIDFIYTDDTTYQFIEAKYD